MMKKANFLAAQDKECLPEQETVTVFTATEIAKFKREAFSTLSLIHILSLPMVLSMLVNSLYNIVDSFFVAQISEEAMTALSLVYPVQNFINAVGIGFGVGINAVIAFHLGAKDHKKADQAATQGLVLAVIHGVVMTVCCIAIMPVFLRMFKMCIRDRSDTGPC